MIGLDFGTTTTLLAADDGVVPLGSSREWMLSLVGFNDDGEVVVGEDAEAAVAGQKIRSIKRAITKRRNVVRVYAPAGVHDVSADDFIVEVLRAAERKATSFGIDLSQHGTARIGCPTVWDGGQRRRFLGLLHRAGVAARWSDLVDEPIAAGIAWLARRPRIDSPTRLLVFDMGGGTLDVAVIDVPDERDVHLLAAVGQAKAGDDLDEAIADDLIAELKIEFELSIQQRELLIDAAAKAKERLSTEDEHPVKLSPRFFPGQTETWYTRAQLEAVFAPQFDEAVQCVTVALRAAFLTQGGSRHAWPAPEELRGEVDVVLLSGGMARVPYVASHLRRIFPDTTRIELAADKPEKAVVQGLTRAAAYARNSRYALPYDVWLEWDEGRESRLIYNAYMPILEQWWIERNWSGELKFRSTGHTLALPSRGSGVLRVVSDVDGVDRGRLNGASLDGYPVDLNGEQFSFTIEPDGRLEMVDGGGTHTGWARDPVT